jgi:hypothetical protein
VPLLGNVLLFGGVVFGGRNTEPRELLPQRRPVAVLLECITISELFGVRTSLDITALVCNAKTLIIPSFASSKPLSIGRDMGFRSRTIVEVQQLDSDGRVFKKKQKHEESSAGT